MANSLHTHPDSGKGMVHPEDNINLDQHPAVVTLEEHNHSMPVDIVGRLEYLPNPDTMADAEFSYLSFASRSPDIAPDRLETLFGMHSGSNDVSGIPIYYNMNHGRRGKAFVFNHMNFESSHLKSRNGTNTDRDNLSVTLEQLNFEVKVYNDLTFMEIERILLSASIEDHSDADCILVTVLSHGELGHLHASDHMYNTDRLWSHFTAEKCRTLAGKPKMFFIQACQGDRLDHGVNMTMTETDAGSVEYKIPNHADFLIAYSTIPGFYSWRNTTEGSWFVQAFCNVLKREAYSTDLLSIMTKVCWMVANDFESNVPNDYVMHGKKQIPWLTSMLTRAVLFTRR